MIEQISIQNFKSLQDVTIDLSQFNCIVGMNGAGKSTILQALDFISQQMHGDMTGWLEARGWEAKDLYCKTGHPRAYSHATTFQVVYRLASGEQVVWRGSFNRTTLRLTQEHIELGINKVPLLVLAEGKFRLGEVPTYIAFEYQGSVLSRLKDSMLPAEVLELRNALRQMRSLELLSPHLLRKRSRSQDKDIGAGGEKLSGYLDSIKGESQQQLLALLQAFYPGLQSFRVATLKGGWKRLLISETFSGSDLFSPSVVETEATHLNDGLLRILAILAQASAERAPIILLDEIENGINPEIVEKLVDVLVNSAVQMIVTTHSPMILNYLEDETARKSVLFVYKAPSGQTGVRRFFDIPRIGEKLNLMGPGEAFVDTNLQQLTDECVRQAGDTQQVVS